MDPTQTSTALPPSLTLQVRKGLLVLGEVSQGPATLEPTLPCSCWRLCETKTKRPQALIQSALNRPRLPRRTGIAQRAVVGQRSKGRVAQLAADEEDDESHR